MCRRRQQGMFSTRARLAVDTAPHALTPSIAINFEHCNVRSRVFVVRGPVPPRPGYVVLRYADSPNGLIVSDGRRSVPRNGALLSTEGEFSRQKDAVMK